MTYCITPGSLDSLALALGYLLMITFFVGLGMGLFILSAYGWSVILRRLGW